MGFYYAASRLQLAAVSYRSSWALEFPFELLHLFIGKRVGCTILLGQHAYVGWLCPYPPTTIPDWWGSLTTQHPPEGSGNDPALKEDLSLFHLAFAIARLSSRAGWPENGQPLRRKSHLFSRFIHPSKLFSDSSEKKHRVDASPLVVHEHELLVYQLLSDVCWYQFSFLSCMTLVQWEEPVRASNRITHRVVAFTAEPGC